MRANGIAIGSTRPGRRRNREDISSKIDRFGGTFTNLMKLAVRNGAT